MEEKETLRWDCVLRFYEKGETMGYLIGWTRQTAEVLKELETTGEYRVKEEYIRKKNGDIAGYYLELYRWYTEKSRAYLPAAVEGEFPIWFSLNSDYRLQKTEGTVIIRARIPGEMALVIDAGRWDSRGNHMYICKNAKDRADFEKLLNTYGIYDETILADRKGIFYPMLRKRMMESWERLFTMPPDRPENGYATTWVLKQEWIEEIIL